MEYNEAIRSQAYENTSAGVDVFIKQEPQMHEDFDSEEYEGFSKTDEVTYSITEELSDVRMSAPVIKEECLQDASDNERVLGHIEEQYESVNAANNRLIIEPSGNTSQEEFILPKPLTKEKLPESKASVTVSTTFEDMDSDLRGTSFDWCFTENPIKEEILEIDNETEDEIECVAGFEDDGEEDPLAEVAPNDELVLVHIGADCENVKDEYHQSNLKSTLNNFPEELILPDKINNFDAIETRVKKEPFSCEEMNEMPKITSFAVCRRVLHPRMHKDYKLEDSNFNGCYSEYSSSTENKSEDLTSNETTPQESTLSDPVTYRLVQEQSKPQESGEEKSMLEESDDEEHTSEDSSASSVNLHTNDCEDAQMHRSNKVMRKCQLKKNKMLRLTLPQQSNISERSFSHAAYLKRHMHTHMSEQLYQCNECGNNYSKKEELRCHILSHNRPHQCKICKKCFCNFATFKVHMSKHAVENPYPCTICKHRFRTKRSLFDHMQMHTGEKPYPCSVCEKRFSKRNRLVVHLRTHTEEKPYRCTICKKRFRTKGNLVEHMHTHVEGKPHHCTVCEMSFRTSRSLVKHMRTHMEEKPCTICEKHFRTNRSLVEHMLTHTGAKPFLCTVCEMRFKSKQSLADHMRMHMGEKLHPCTVCEKHFCTNRSLVEHMRTHTGKKPYLCTVCEKRFKSKQCLTDHMRMHTGEKPYTCTVCKKSYRRKCALNRHMHMHTGDKTYLCTVCKKRFNQNANLLRHMRTHTEEKMYLCTVCEKRFSEKSNMFRHMRTHTEGKTYPCTICEKRFRKQQNLVEHMRKH